MSQEITLGLWNRGLGRYEWRYQFKLKEKLFEVLGINDNDGRTSFQLMNLEEFYEFLRKCVVQQFENCSASDFKEDYAMWINKERRQADLPDFDEDSGYD